MHDDWEIWLEYARRDIKTASVLANAGEDLWFDVCFHSQQAVEKCFKALIVRKGVLYPKIHNLIDLLAVVDKQEFNTLRDDITYVDKFYIASRYPIEAIPTPNGFPPGETEGKKALNIADNILRLTEEVLLSGLSAD